MSCCSFSADDNHGSKEDCNEGEIIMSLVELLVSNCQIVTMNPERATLESSSIAINLSIVLILLYFDHAKGSQDQQWDLRVFSTVSFTISGRQEGFGNTFGTN